MAVKIKSILPFTLILLLMSKTFFVFIFSLFILISIFFIKIKQIKFRKVYIVALFPIVYWIFNLILSNRLDQVLYLNFFRYDGVFITVWFIFILILLISSYIYSTTYDFLIQYIQLGITFSVILIFFDIFSSHNAIAGFVGEIIIVLLFILHLKPASNNIKLLYIGLLLFLLVIFFLNQSRAFLLAEVIAVIYLITAINKSSFSKKIIYLCSLSTVILILIFVSGTYARIQYATTGEDFNVLTRFALWNLASEYWLQNTFSIFFGHGIGFFNDISLPQIYNETFLGKYHFGQRHSHNIILQLLVEQGLVGLTVFFASILYLIKSITNHHLKTLNKVLFIYLFVASQFGLNFFTPSTSLLFYFILANSLQSGAFYEKS